jgi:predicted transglutaminase-like cysteine proteinase
MPNNSHIKLVYDENTTPYSQVIGHARYADMMVRTVRPARTAAGRLLCKTPVAVAALLAGISLSGASLAEPYNAYPFTDQQDLLARAEVFESWHDAVTAHNESRPALYACAEDASACRGRLKSFNRLMQRTSGLSSEEQIELVNYYINRGRYDDDRRRRVHDENGKRVGWQRNSWTSLHNFLLKGGDCEDYASSKYFMLRELGFPAEEMRVVVARSRELGGSHAVLAVRRPDGAVWLLDSDNRIRKRSHRGYRYIYAMNEHYVWDHRKDYLGPEALSNAETQVHNGNHPVDGKSAP